jgi:6-phosphogluconolactonase
MTAPDLRVFAHSDEVAAAAAREVAQRLAAAARQHGSPSIVLAGGATPRGLYRRLAADHRDDVPWDRVQFFWGDERIVTLDDERSNYRMARGALIDGLPVRPEHVHPMPTGLVPQQAAHVYEQMLRSHFANDWPRFDLVLLGIGADGHTASLFPGSPALQESARWVVATTAPVDPRDRLTLTFPALLHAAAIFVLATGASKAEAIRGALAEDADPQCPASLIRAAEGHVVWWLDAEAGARVNPRTS